MDTHTTWRDTLQEFAVVYKLYRKGGHGHFYSLRTAYRIAVQGMPF